MDTTLSVVERMPALGQQLRLLSLDGGGVRGLASLQVLKMLLGNVGGQKPCKFFDMICGTSTGGLIAIMLGILEMTIDDCIKAFSLMMSKAFVQKHSSRFSFRGKIQARYSTTALEDCIKTIIDNERKTGTRMRDVREPSCKVVIVAMDMQSMKPVHFTNYHKSGEVSVFENITVLDAALATTAATSFFDNKEITTSGITRCFGDAALGRNNPVNGLWAEAKEVYGLDVEARVRCLVSLGTGAPQNKEFGSDIKAVAKSIIQIAEATEATGEDFRNSNGLADRGVYYRFNPPDVYNIKMDNVRMGGNIQALTGAYLGTGDTKEKIKRFQRDNGEEQMAAIAPQPRFPQMSTRLFDNLSTSHIKPNTTYWRHLTLEGYKNYQRIYDNCFPPGQRLKKAVTYTTFLNQFKENNSDRYDPEEGKVEEVWSRLLTRGTYVDTQHSSQPEGLVMATIYMLHVETSAHTKYERPIMENGERGVDRSRREVLKRFAKWVPCKCSASCGKKWNFVNDVGIGSAEGNDRKCRIVKLMDGNSARNLLAAKDEKALGDMKRDWYLGVL